MNERHVIYLILAVQGIAVVGLFFFAIPFPGIAKILFGVILGTSVAVILVLLTVLFKK